MNFAASRVVVHAFCAPRVRAVCFYSPDIAAMTKATTDKLFVNLSASQTRKRLKGHGFGVKKVEAAGRNQSVIVHTATEGHLRELESLFADVMSSSSHADLDIPVENLRNLGTASAVWLREIGVHTRSDLERLGPVLAYRLVKQRLANTSLNLLWAGADLVDRKSRNAGFSVRVAATRINQAAFSNRFC